MKKLLLFVAKYPHVFGIALFVVTFIVTRFPYYSSVNLPYVFDDTPVYVGNVDDMLHGEFGLSGLTLGYPLFLLICKLISRNIEVVTYVQSAVTLATGIGFLLLMQRSFKELVVAAAISLTVFTSSILFVHFETTVLTESLFANSVILTTGAMAAVVARQSTKRWMLFSATIIIALLIRPAGLYLIPVWIVALAMVIYRQRSWLSAAVYISPMVLYYLVIAVLGMIASKSDGSPSGLTPALATNTISYLQPDPSLPNHVNRVIREYLVPKQVPEELQYIRTGTEIRNVSSLYLKYQTYSYGFRDSLLAANNGSYAGLSRDYSAIITVARRNHLDDMIRFFKIQFLHYFDSFDHKRTSAYPFFESYLACFRDARIANYAYHQYNRTGYVGSYPQFVAPRIAMSDLQHKYDVISVNSASDLIPRLFQYHHKIFRNLYWVYAYAALSILWLFLLFRSKENRDYAILFTLLSVSNLLYMVVVSVNISMIRYNFPLHFVIYFIVTCSLTWIILNRTKSSSIDASKAGAQLNSKRRASKKR